MCLFQLQTYYPINSIKIKAIPLRTEIYPVKFKLEEL